MFVPHPAVAHLCACVARPGARACVQVPRCTEDLRAPGLKAFYARRCVCPIHAAADDCEFGIGCPRQRFCMQCTRFHRLECFDGPKRCVQLVVGSGGASRRGWGH